MSAMMTNHNYSRDEAARLYQVAINSQQWQEANRLRQLIESHGG